MNSTERLAEALRRPGPRRTAPARARCRDRVALLLCCIAVAGQARAEFVSNEELAGWLQESAKRGGSFKDSTLALGFVTAVHDLIPEDRVCVPDRTAARTLVRAIHDWMNRDGSPRGTNGARTVQMALEELYPCPPGGRE